MNNIGINTIWHWQHFIYDILFNEWVEDNLCVLEGRNHVLDSAFGGGSQITPWYVAPFEDNHKPASGDNYATPGYTECTAYDEAIRPGWQGGSAVAAVIDNDANRASFTFNAIKTIYGAGLVGGGSAPSTKGDAAGGGVLFCASKFSVAENVIAGSVLKVKIEITLNAV